MEEKVIFNQKRGDDKKPAPQEPKPPLFEIKYYGPSVKQPIFQPRLPQMVDSNNSPIIYRNTINIPPPQYPTGPHRKLYPLYEDVLPLQTNNATSNTIGERIMLFDFVRASIFNNKDGQDIDIDDGNVTPSNRSLLSYIKYGDLNPFNANKLSDNPYKGLPPGFLIYRSCYPIRQNPQTKQIKCANNALSMNIRIYRLPDGAYPYNEIKTEKPQKLTDYNQWREIKFYEYIRENIIKRKVCPTFPIMFGYFISLNSKIDFDGINMIRNKPKFDREDAMITIPGDVPYQDYREYSKTSKPTLIELLTQRYGTRRNIKYDGLLQHKVTNPKAYTGKVMTIITESPTFKFLDWASIIYAREGDNFVMVNRGSHDISEWYNVLFQLAAGLYTLQKHKIYIQDFSVNTNIFIKDIEKDPGTFWKYTINGINYFVPNKNVLVMIDSNYHHYDNTTDNEKTLYAPFIGNELSDTEYQTKIFEMFKKCIDPNLFGSDFTNSGGVKPPDEIASLLNNIQREYSLSDAPTDISYYIATYLGTPFLHSRIGTLVTVEEYDTNLVKNNDNIELKHGMMVAFDIGQSYKVVLIEKVENNTITYLTKQDAINVIRETSNDKSKFYIFKNTSLLNHIDPSDFIIFSSQNQREAYII